MVKQKKITAHLVGEDCNLEDPLKNNPLYNLFEMDFRVESLWVFNKLKETIELKRTNKTQENMRAKTIKIIKAEITTSLPCVHGYLYPHFPLETHVVSPSDQ